MSLEGEFTVRHQRGGQGVFATVRVHIASRAGAEDLEILAATESAARWKEALYVGLRTGWRLLPSKLTRDRVLSVDVQGMDRQPGNTTEIVVVLAAARALLAAFNVDVPRSPAFVPEHSTFIFSN